MELHRPYIMTFLALFLFAEKLSAQHDVSHSPDLRLHRLEYENSSGEKAMTTFYYNDRGIMDKATWLDEDSKRSSENIYRYNDKNQLISAYREFSDKLTSYEMYLYDEAGRKTHETFIRSDGIQGTADFVYDKKGRCEKVICNKYKGWINGDILYKYKKDRPAHEAVIVRDGEIIGTIVFDYDNDGNLIKDTWTFASGWQQIFIYHYESVVDQP